MKKVLLMISIFALTGCATHVVKLGDVNKTYAPKNPQSVEVYYRTKPNCKYEEIALIDNPLGGLFSKWSNTLQGSVNQIKKVAAEQGADFIVLEEYHKKSFSNDKLVDAVVAYKCVN